MANGKCGKTVQKLGLRQPSTGAQIGRPSQCRRCWKVGPWLDDSVDCGSDMASPLVFDTKSVSGCDSDS